MERKTEMNFTTRLALRGETTIQTYKGKSENHSGDAWLLELNGLRIAEYPCGSDAKAALERLILALTTEAQA